uniref:phenylacetate--CoA ligase family protein n=1 Tax=uncultured Halomonas sp. TaxID=173971 RepID=UPI002623D914|nr:hypothetical protein [uncultured Halomonas sp.]
MISLSKIYDLAPIWLQNVMVTAAGYRNNRTRYGLAYYEYKKFLKVFDTLPLSKKLEHQRLELVRFIRHARDNSEFYKKSYKDIDVNAIQSLEDIKRLPIVDKEMLRINANEVFTITREDAIEGHTGGTTGKSLVVLMTPDDMMKRMAMLDHFKERVGFKHRSMRRATFNGKHIVPPAQKKKVFWRYNHACKQMIYSSFHITEKNAGYYVKSLNSFKPHALDGFFTCMIDIANYIERKNIKLDFRPVGIFPTSETLTDSGRDLLEKVFNCKVYDQYASSEGAPFVTECKDQRLHIELASGFFEYFQEGSSNEILVTSFTTHGTPLIRYRIGDSMVLSKEDNVCSCGMHTPLVESIRGRELDFLYTAEGAKVNAGNVANLFKNMPNALIRAQTRQEELGQILVLLEVDKEAYKQEYDDLLRDEFLHKFGSDTQVFIEHVDEIPRERSGKFRMVKNLVPGE